MASVSSVLPESTTTTSSAQAALSMASAICPASLSVMIVTVTRGTVVMLSQGCALSRRGRSLRLRRSLQGRFLDGLQIDDRAMEIQDVLQLHVAREREIALRLEYQKARRRAGLELSLLGLELALGQLTRRTRALHALLVRLDVARRGTNLRRNLQLLLAQTRRGLAPLQLNASEVRLSAAGSDRVADVQSSRPARILILEKVPENRSEAALCAPKHISSPGSERTDTALELRAAETLQAVIQLRADIRQHLVAVEA